MELVTGSYTGNGVDDRWINDPGFEPDLVAIKGNAAQYAVWRSSSMAGDASATFSFNDMLIANQVQSLGANGFQVGTSAKVNSAATTYHWIAIRDDGAGDFAVGSYTGNGADNRNLDVVGFQPTVLWIKCCSVVNARGAWRVDESVGDSTLRFIAVTNYTNGIQTLRPLGFQVGTGNQVNANLAAYYYVAFKDVADSIETGTYVGDGADDRWINDAGFQPDVVFIKGNTAQVAVLRTDTMAGDLSGPFHNVALAADQIQSLGANGFQVGTNARVNQNLIDYFWAAWATAPAAGGQPTSLRATTIPAMRQWQPRIGP